MTNEMSAYINSLLLSHPLREPLMQDAIHLMDLPLASYGLDVGCGIGLNTFLIAEKIGPQGRIVGLDSEEEMLSKARSLLSGTEVEGRIAVQKGNAGELGCLADDCFDWACSIDCVGTVDLNPVAVLKELNRAVKPEGRVFIMIWSSQMLLPGYPQLETKLNATSAGIAPFAAGMVPDRHIMRAPEWFNQAGFTDIRAHTLARDICSPLDNEIKAALIDLFAMRWGGVEKEVSPEVWRDYQHLCRPDSPDFILHNANYYAFFTYSLFSGLVI